MLPSGPRRGAFCTMVTDVLSMVWTRPKSDSAFGWDIWGRRGRAIAMCRQAQPARRVRRRSRRWMPHCSTVVRTSRAAALSSSVNKASPSLASASSSSSCGPLSWSAAAAGTLVVKRKSPTFSASAVATPAAAPRPVLASAMVTMVVASAGAQAASAPPDLTPARASSKPARPRSTPKMHFGNAARAELIKASPKSTAKPHLKTPRTKTAAPPRAPKWYWPAKPPEPWQAGIPPKKQQITFMAPTDVEIPTRVGTSARRDSAA
mmetsp:Transcript_18582/g.62710  ORF Transcript_18582/g.62710 Transcript_18582/m.62710 type:complete len:263 (+) Transcript_18582:1127-1915(+)